MIKIESLNKNFSSHHVLKNVSLEIDSGNVTAIVGPNGSGKTTLIKCILGLVKPGNGSINVGGTDTNISFTYRNKIGYMPQVARFPENLTASELLSMVKDLRESEYSGEKDIINSFKLADEMDKPFKSLSGGTKQKVSAAIAFTFNPEILILDEPTAGLDPVASSHFKDMIFNEKNNGKTIILTSHIMSEIQELSDEIVFLLDGEIKYKGALTSLIETNAGTTLERAIAELMVSKE